MKKTYFILFMMFALTIFCSCGGYVKSYVATILITSSHGDEANMKFDTFKGTYNFKLKSDDFEENSIDIEASLGEGTMNIYIGTDGEKELILTLNSCEAFEKTIFLDEKYSNKKTVYIILESNGKCFNGDFEFEYN